MHNCNKTINIGMGCCHQVLGPIWDYYNKQEVDELIEDIIAGDIDLSGYVTDERLAEILEEYAKNGDLEALRQRLEEEVDKLSTEIEKRAQKDDIEALEERVEDIETKIDDVEGVTEEKVNEMIKDKADKSDLNDYQLKGDYATKDEIPSLEGYATEQWVTDKNYLTEHQHLKTVNGNSLIGDGNIIIEGGGESVDLSDYYTKGESDERYGQKSVLEGLQSQITSIGEELSTKADESALEGLKDELEGYATKDEIPSLEGYATEEWVEEKNYLTEHQHLKTVNGESLVGDGNIVIEGGDVDLSGYYTKEESDGRFGSKEEQESLRNDVEEALGESAKNEADLQKKADKEELDNYQPKGDYALKSEIPSLEGYVTKEELSEISSLKIWQGTQTEYDYLDTYDEDTLYLLYK